MPKKEQIKKFNVVQDSREQTPLEFSSASIDYTIVDTLKTGDYTIEGLEDVLCIERKGSLLEFYKNITQPRFWREMERMQNYKYRFLVLEFGVDKVETFPYSLDKPKSFIEQLQMTAQYLMRCISVIQVKYNINVVFAENRSLATYLITNIMKRVNEYESATET